MSGSSQKTNATTGTQIAAFRVQSSIAGGAQTMIYGRTRVPINLLQFVDFRAVPHTTTSRTAGGKGGGNAPGTSDTQFTYTAALIMAIGLGPVKSIVRGWVGKAVFGASTVNAWNNIATDLPTTIPADTGTFAVGLASVYVANVSVVWIGAELKSDGRTFNTGDTLIGNGVNYSNDAYGNYAFAPDFRGAENSIQINYLVSSTTATPSALPGMGLSLIGGWDGQAPWGYMQTAHPEQALGYSGIAYLCAPAYDLGSNAELPNHNVEVSTYTEFSPTIVDAEPSVIIADFLNNGRYGVPTWNPAATGDLAALRLYCIAQGLFLSPALDTQQAAAQWLTYLLSLINCDVRWSAGKLAFIPLGDAAVTGNGATFTPNTTPVYDLTTDHFIVTDDTMPPVDVQRKAPSDTYNQVQLEFYDRADGYSTQIMPATDDADVQDRGLRTQSVTQAHAICDKTIASMAAQLILQRQLGVRNTYTFTLPWTFALLEPLDLVTLTVAALGLYRVPVRINEIEEGDDDTFKVTAEDCPIGMASAPAYGVQAAAGFAHDYNVDPGSVVTPFFFEAPVDRTTTGLAVWAAVSGSSPNWGGANVWASVDGLHYELIGKTTGARYGAMTAPLVSGPAATLSVTLAGRGGAVTSVSAPVAAADGSLAFVGDASGGEWIDYQGAALAGPNAYNLTGLFRGRFGSPANARASGTVVIVNDAEIAKGDDLPLSMIGQTIFFKCTSFNVYGGGEQSLADVVGYSYTITGAMAKLPPSDVGLITVAFEKFGVRLSWPKDADPDVVAYELRTDGTFWENATLLTTVAGTSYLWGVQLSGGRTIRIKAIDSFGNYSTNNSTQLVLVPLPAPTSLSAAISGPNVVLAWSAVAGAYAIDHYTVRLGATFDSAAELAQTLSTTFMQKVAGGGSLRYWVAAVDVAGNVGPAVSTQVDVVAPGAPAPGNAGHNGQEVIDNNVLLYWSPPTSGTLPIDRYEVRKGTSFAAGALVGSNGNSTFAGIFESQSGTYTYWIAGIDTAGNVGAATGIVATVNQPPDYILRSSIDSVFGHVAGGVYLAPDQLVGMYVEDGKLYGPSFGETFDAHFASRGWATPQDQINAGDPLYFEPAAASCYYEETFDYGAVIGGTTVTVTLATAVLSGSPTAAVQISYKLNAGDSWTDAAAGALSAFASNFRYVKVRINVTGGGAGALLEIGALNVKLSVKLKTDSGIGTANASDADGTLVYFGIPFIQAFAPVIQPSGATPQIGMPNFVDAPNPTSFRVLLYDTSGNRVSGPFSWTARGY